MAAFRPARGRAAATDRYKQGRGVARLPRPRLPQQAPGPAAPPPPQGIGIDPRFDADIGAIDRDTATSLAGLEQQQGQLGAAYGLGVDASGNVFDDPSNPFSRAAALAQSYRNAQRGTTNSMAARGQLYAGSLQNAQNEVTNQNQRLRDAMIREFMGRIGDITQAKARIKNEDLSARDRAAGDRVDRALQARPDAAAVPSSAPAPKPKAGFQFVMKSGPRAGMSYKLVPGKGGKLERLYENGYREAR